MRNRGCVHAQTEKRTGIRKEDEMNEIATLKEQIEVIRKELDEAAAENMADEQFYSLSLKMDELIEQYLGFCSEKSVSTEN